MANVSPAEINRLCSEWCKATAVSGGGLRTDAESEKFRLLHNGVVFHELDHASLSAAVCSLTMVLLSNHGTITSHDHYGAWAWCGELILNSGESIAHATSDGLLQLFRACLNAALADVSAPVTNKEQQQAFLQAYLAHPHFAKEYQSTSRLALAYLSFPLLEGICKRKCSTYMNEDGAVVHPFTVTDASGRAITYDPAGRKRRCSSLRDLLLLLHGQVANPSLRANLDVLRGHLAQLDPTVDPFDTVFSWRNQTLHGEANFQSVGGTILSWAILVSLDDLEPDFETRRSTAAQHAHMRSRMGHRLPLSFYPPI